MTVDYRTDGVVLRHLLGRPYRYLGVLRGCTGPISLSINSQTPNKLPSVPPPS